MYGQYNPYGMSAPRPSYGQGYGQQMPSNNYLPAYLKGRMVTSMDEARAAQIDLDGTSTFFPCPAEGKIYEKCIDLNGLPIFKVYEIAKPQERPAFADKSFVDNLVERVEKLEQRLGEMNYVESDATYGNVAAQQQPFNVNGNANGQQPSVG